MPQHFLVYSVGEYRVRQASPWPTDGPPALHAENVAIAVALLWIVQLRAILPKVDSTIRFDCMAGRLGGGRHLATDRLNE